VPANALPPFWSTFRQTYLPKDGTPLSTARCQTCHVNAAGGARNVYGKLIEATLKAEKATVLTAAILKKTESVDSDEDGWTNGAEIAAVMLPGDPNSHPNGEPPATPAAQVSTTPGRSSGSPLLPPHSFHPIIVHFPIALFMFGCILEVLGAWKGRTELCTAGYFNVLIGSLSAPVAATTGFIMVFRRGYPIEGLVLAHLTLALASTAGMLATAYLGRSAARAGRERASRLYWFLLVASAVLVAVAGHLGGMLVYGS